MLREPIEMVAGSGGRCDSCSGGTRPAAIYPSFSIADAWNCGDIELSEISLRPSRPGVECNVWQGCDPGLIAFLKYDYRLDFWYNHFCIKYPQQSFMVR
jgi:hypothetical protein